MSGSSWPVTVMGICGAGLVSLYIAGLMWAMEHDSYNLWGSMLMVPCLIWINVVLVIRASKSEPGEWFGKLLMVALALKMATSLLRYWVAFVMYKGVADAAGYNLYAASQYQVWRQGRFVWDFDSSSVTGTDFLRLATTGVYTVIGPAPITGFIVFASMAFWGTYFIYRAFRIAFPQGENRRFALLLFLLPSILYWPASIGKDAWILLFIGITALGAARIFAGLPGAYLLVALGLWGTAMVRPHFAALLVAGIAVAQLLRPAKHQGLGLLAKVAGLAVILGAALLVTGATTSFLGIDDLSADGIAEGLEGVGTRTAGGGSAFTASPVLSPLEYPWAMLTVLFRPFPWEAGNPQMFVSALEGVFLVGITIASWIRLRQLPRYLGRYPFLIFAGAYDLLFIYAFSSFSNFGLLARERSLLLPFFLMFLSVPLPPDAVRRRAEAKEIDRSLAYAR